jgi:microcystin-dependent protein
LTALSAGTTGNDDATSAATGGGGAHNNVQPYMVLNHIIKT